MVLKETCICISREKNWKWGYIPDLRLCSYCYCGIFWI